ncbi:MAG: TRAM domain-containing protein [Vicinamibacteraceae bacterium]|nr:TRAM domain-containing protein [Vicinamibacteraceae bacterium]
MTPGHRHRVLLERMVQGGRVLGRVDGEVVLVAGGIPGETVLVQVSDVRRGVALADVVDVLEASSDRRDVFADLACGGLALGHIAYPRQVALKQDVLVDAFRRIGRVTLAAPPTVVSSPEERYRMRARVHLRGGRLGAFRERTHEVCSMALTRQLSEASDELLDRIEREAARHGVADVEAIEITENAAATERALHLETGVREVPAAWLAALAGLPGVRGVSRAHRREDRARVAAGEPWVSDPVASFAASGASFAPAGASFAPPGASSPEAPDAGAGPAMLRRQAHAFFQANRYLTPSLVACVLGRLGGGPVVDLYAGVGLFAVCAAAAGRDEVVAVERDETSGADLEANARPWGERLRVVHETVESFVGRGRLAGAGTLIVDPPRTGMSRAVVDGILAARVPALVYVSCDTATLARDTARLLGVGYRLAHLEAFDLFPNTPHIETVAVFA